MRFEFLGFGDDVVDTARNLFPADERNGAVGAAAVAAFGNLQVGVVLESAQVHARQVLCIASLRCHDAHLLQKFARPVGAYPVIDFGKFLYEFIAVAARKATRNDQLLLVLLAVNLCENRVDGFLFRGFDKSAGVHQDVVRLGGGVAGGKTGVQHLADQVFRIDLVLGASKMNDKNFGLLCRHSLKFRK